MKVAVKIETKKIVDIMPDNTTKDSAYLVNNGYVLLDLENPVIEYVDDENGNIYAVFRELTDNDFTEYSKENFKKIRDDLVSKIVISYNNNSFQGDELSQSRMSRSITGMTEDDTIRWKTSDNKEVVLTKTDLAEILRRAGQEQTRIWFEH